MELLSLGYDNTTTSSIHCLSRSTTKQAFEDIKLLCLDYCLLTLMRNTKESTATPNQKNQNVFQNEGWQWQEGKTINNFTFPVHNQRDHSLKTSACPRGEGCPHVLMVVRSQYIRIKNPLHKHFAEMPMVGVKNRENLPTS